MRKVFVYGTLKRGKRLNRLLENSKFIEEDCIKGKLYTRSYPFYFRGKGKVKGEIWDISDKDWTYIEEMEIDSGYNVLKVKTENEIDVLVFEAGSQWAKQIKNNPEGFRKITSY